MGLALSRTFRERPLTEKKPSRRKAFNLFRDLPTSYKENNYQAPEYKHHWFPPHTILMSPA